MTAIASIPVTWYIILLLRFRKTAVEHFVACQCEGTYVHPFHSKATKIIPCNRNLTILIRDRDVIVSKHQMSVCEIHTA